MFALNRDEKKAVFVLLVLACIGLCTRFAAKMNQEVRSYVSIERSIAQFDANKVTCEDLLRTRVLSRKVAESFIAFRNERGSFRDLEDVKNVPGIGDQRFEKLKNILYVD